MVPARAQKTEIIQAWFKLVEMLAEKIIGEANTLFEDVIEDFSTVPPILAKFDEWKQRYRQEYNDAYIGLCLPKLLTPVIKLSLIDWNPLEVWVNGTFSAHSGRLSVVTLNKMSSYYFTGNGRNGAISSPSCSWLSKQLHYIYFESSSLILTPFNRSEHSNPDT